MDIYQAVDARFSARDFLENEVPVSVLKKVLEAAVRSPSGGNLQPWHIHVVSGDALKNLKGIMQHRVGHPEDKEETEFDIYPANLKSPYRERRFQIGEDLYAKLNIQREDKAARRAWFQRNFAFFGAPLALFFTIDRSMGSPQWADLGMLMQTIMLLLKAEGLDSCAQECWSNYPQTIASFLKLAPEQMLFSGMAVGYANTTHPVNQLRSQRAPMDEVVQFHQ